MRSSASTFSAGRVCLVLAVGFALAALSWPRSSEACTITCIGPRLLFLDPPEVVVLGPQGLGPLPPLEDWDASLAVDFGFDGVPVLVNGEPMTPVDP